MELSARMQAVAALVPSGHTAVDIGCDHGYVAVSLVQRGVCPRVYAADMRSGPLSRAREHIRRAGLSEQVIPVLSDGLDKVPVGEGDVRTAVAAGMGGRLTIKILSDHPEKTAMLWYLILEPQSEAWLVRGWLSEHGFSITGEDLVWEDGKFYPIIQAASLIGETQKLAVSAQERQTRLFLELCENGFSRAEAGEAIRRFGPSLLSGRHPVLFSFLEHMIEKEKQLQGQLAAGEERQPDTKGRERICRRRQELAREAGLARKAYCFLNRPQDPPEGRSAWGGA